MPKTDKGKDTYKIVISIIKIKGGIENSEHESPIADNESSICNHTLWLGYERSGACWLFDYMVDVIRRMD